MSELKGRKECPTCKNVPANGDEINFCYKDGAKLIRKAIVCKCGVEMSPFDSFCEMCGSPKEQATEKIIGEK